MDRSRALLLALLLISGLTPGPAYASVTGGLVGHCTMHIPSWPGEGAGTCGNDTTPALAEVAAAGVDNQGIPYVVGGAGSFGASFTYDAPCILGEPSPVWTASGAFEVRNVTSTQGAATLRSDLAITFLGFSGILLTSNSRISFASGNTATGLAPNAGVVQLLPLLGGNVCPTGGSMRAVAAWADAEPA